MKIVDPLLINLARKRVQDKVKLQKYYFTELNCMLSSFFSLKHTEETYKKVVLIRHAQSFGNVKQILYGVTDYELTDHGKSQASW